MIMSESTAEYIARSIRTDFDELDETDPNYRNKADDLIGILDDLANNSNMEILRETRAGIYNDLKHNKWITAIT